MIYKLFYLGPFGYILRDSYVTLAKFCGIRWTVLPTPTHTPFLFPPTTLSSPPSRGWQGFRSKKKRGSGCGCGCAQWYKLFYLGPYGYILRDYKFLLLPSFKPEPLSPLRRRKHRNNQDKQTPFDQHGNIVPDTEKNSGECASNKWSDILKGAVYPGYSSSYLAACQ